MLDGRDPLRKRPTSVFDGTNGLVRLISGDGCHRGLLGRMVVDGVGVGVSEVAGPYVLPMFALVGPAVVFQLVVVAAFRSAVTVRGGSEVLGCNDSTSRETQTGDE